MSPNSKQNKISRWYFGGMASGGAACVTHPLDLLKVTLQTQQEGKLSIFQLTGKIIRQQGVFALYNGISASLLRQMTYSTTRFGIYEVGKQKMGNDTGFLGKILLAGGAGAAGGKTIEFIIIYFVNELEIDFRMFHTFSNRSSWNTSRYDECSNAK